MRQDRSGQSSDKSEPSVCSDKPIHHGDRPGPDPFSGARFGGSGRDLYAYSGTDLVQKKILPPLEISQNGKPTDSRQAHMAVLFNKSASAEEKLASVSKLYDSGLRNLDYQDQNGRVHNFRLEKMPAGSSGREMVHLFGKDSDGSQKTVLRGIANTSGHFEKERDSNGRFVDYYGKGKAQLDANAAAPADTTQDPHRPNPNPKPKPPYNTPPGPDIPPDKPDHSGDHRPPLDSSHKPMDPVTDPSILRDVGRRPDGKPVEPTYIGVDNSASYLGADGKKHIKAGTPAWLDKPAAQAYLMMNEKLARVGKHIQIASEDGSSDGAINSAGRTHTQQRIATGLHAAPGNSVHEQGRGLDVRNYQDPDVRAALREFGFVQGNLSRPNVPIRGDAWHFSFDQRAEASIARRWPNA